VLESEFRDSLVSHLDDGVADCQVASEKAITYNLSFDDSGNLDLGQNRRGEPTRAVTGFSTDLLLYERSSSGDTQIVPRVAVEVKMRSMSTHHAIAYSEKAHRHRSIYPYLRYGLLIGEKSTIPGVAKILRFGQEFDFLTSMEVPLAQDEMQHFQRVLEEEVQASRQMAKTVEERWDVKEIRRRLEFVPPN
jgi:hypothetical protein